MQLPTEYRDIGISLSGRNNHNNNVVVTLVRNTPYIGTVPRYASLHTHSSVPRYGL